MSYYAKIIEYGLYLLVFLLPIQTRWIIKAGELNGGYWEYGTISLYATDIILIILIGLFGYSKIKNRKSEIGNRRLGYWWLIAGLELMIFISIFVATDKLVAGYCYGRFLLGIGLFWLIISANISKIKLIISLLLGIVGQALLGMWQFLAQDSFSCKWLGLAVHHAGSLGASVVETLAGERWLRAYGGLDHPNILGGLLVIGILLVVWLLVINPKSQIPNPKQITNYKLSPPWRDPAYEKLYKKVAGQITIYFLLLTFIVALFFTFSRGAWAGLLVGLLAMLIIAVIRKDLLAQKKILLTMLVGGIMVFILFTQYQGLALTRLSKDTRLEIKSNMERVESFKTAKELIKGNWLLGVGMGNYTKAVHDQIIDSQPSYFYQPAHNVFLLVLAEIGFFGLLFFLGFLLLTSYFLLKRFKENQGLNIYRFSLIAALVVMFLVDHWWWSLHFGVLFFWLILGLIIGDYKKNY